MKLLIDCTSASDWKGHPTGIQRVVFELGKQIELKFRSAIPVVFNSRTCFEYDIKNQRKGNKVSIGSNDVILSPGSNWDNPDHSEQLIELSSKGCNLVPVFYDILPLIMPHSFGPGFSEIYERWFNQTLQVSKIGFTISENTRLDIIKYGDIKGLVRPELFTVRLGDDITNTIGKPSSRLSTYNDLDYILCVGTIEYRKNHRTILNAYRYLYDEIGYEPPYLIIVGKQGWLDQDIVHQVHNDLRLKGHVSILNDLLDADLCHLYRNAKFTLFPSLYEGWGLPIAESLSFGKPCIASGVSSMLEISPDLVNFVPPLDVITWANEIRHLSENKKYLDDLSNKIKNDYLPTSWESTAMNILELLFVSFPELYESNS